MATPKASTFPTRAQLRGLVDLPDEAAPVPATPSASELLRKAAGGLPSSTWRRSVPEGAGMVHEFRLGYDDMAAWDGTEVFTDELLSERGDLCASFVPAGLGILPKDERFALDLRFRGDVGREEARAILRAVVRELSEVEASIDRLYNHWEKQKAERGIDERDLSGVRVQCLGGWDNSGAIFAAALDSIPDHARATVRAHWRRLEEERGAGFPMVCGGGKAEGKPLRDFGGINPDGGAFTFDPCAPTLPPDVAQSAAVLMLAKAHMVATGDILPSWGGMVMEMKRHELEALATSWGADLPTMRELVRAMGGG